MVHDLNPFIFKITETFGPRWYGFAYLLGFFCAYLILKWLTQRQNTGFTSEMLSDFITYCAFGTLIGGRLGYCVFYDQELIWSFRSSVPFWGVLAVNEGGMASHGGIIGIATACFLFAKKYAMNPIYLLDLVSIASPAGVFFGRMANFINGELVGRVAPNDFPYGVRFPSDILNWPQYEFERLNSLSTLIDKVGVSASQWNEWVTTFRQNSVSRDQVYNSLNEIILKIQNGDSTLKTAIGPLLDYRYPSQLFAGATEGIFTFMVLIFLSRKSRKPGFVAGAFGICYAMVRTFNEMFRAPDIQLGFQALGLTRGQWLSVAMFLFSVGIMFYWHKTQTQTIHGWLRGEHVKLGSRK